MNRRLTHILVSIVTVALIVATLVFGLVQTRSGRAGMHTSVASVIPLIAHPVNDSLMSCVHCHRPGPEGTPPRHASYTAATCLTCHEVAPAAAIVRHRAAPLAPRDTARSPEASPTQAASPATKEEPVAGPIPHALGAPYEDCVACHAIGGNLSMPGNHSSYANPDCTHCHMGSATGKP
jgi:hypothetical protein